MYIRSLGKKYLERLRNTIQIYNQERCIRLTKGNMSQINFNYKSLEILIEYYFENFKFFDYVKIIKEFTINQNFIQNRHRKVFERKIVSKLKFRTFTNLDKTRLQL